MFAAEKDEDPLRSWFSLGKLRTEVHLDCHLRNFYHQGLPHAGANLAQQQNPQRMAEEHLPVAMTDLKLPEQVLAVEDVGSTPSEEGNERETGYIKGWPLLLTTIA